MTLATPPEMRSVVFLVSHSSAGGAQEIWANLAEGFALRGHRVQLMALYPLRDPACRTAPGLAWRYVARRRPKTPWAVAGILLKLAGIMRRDAPDMVFTAMPAANTAAALAGALAGARQRVAISHHSPAETHSRIFNAIDSLTGGLGSVNTVISVSAAVSESLSSKPARYRGKRRTIHNALPPRIENHLATLAAQHAPRTMRRRSVVATGRLAAQKNYPLLIRAARHVPDATFDIIGTGPDEAMLRDLAQVAGVADRVRFVGHRPREEALALLAEGDVFVQASLFEGHSLGLIEAAHLGLPLVVSDVPSQIEGITARDGTLCGLTAGIEEDVKLAGHINSLLDNPQIYAEYSARARRLGAEATYAAMIDAYEELAR